MTLEVFGVLEPDICGSAGLVLTLEWRSVDSLVVAVIVSLANR